MTPEALDLLGPYLDAWRVDVKGFKDEFYRKLAKITHWEGILETAERAKHKWNMHLEVITNVIPTMNDDDEQFKGIAHWIHDKLGELTPWHVTRFYPQYQAGITGDADRDPGTRPGNRPEGRIEIYLYRQCSRP